MRTWQGTCNGVHELKKGARMRTRIVISLVASVIAVGVLNAQSSTKIKHVQLTKTSPASGEEMFSHYCAVCHGADGRGGGPAAAALKTQPSDLTRLSANSGGTYPELRVLETLSA